MLEKTKKKNVNCFEIKIEPKEIQLKICPNKSMDGSTRTSYVLQQFQALPMTTNSSNVTIPRCVNGQLARPEPPRYDSPSTACNSSSVTASGGVQSWSTMFRCTSRNTPGPFETDATASTTSTDPSAHAAAYPRHWTLLRTEPKPPPTWWIQQRRQWLRRRRSQEVHPVVSQRAALPLHLHPPPSTSRFNTTTAVRRSRTARWKSRRSNITSTTNSKPTSSWCMGTTWQVSKEFTKATATLELQELQYSRHATDARELVSQVDLCHCHLPRRCSKILACPSSRASSSPTWPILDVIPKTMAEACLQKEILTPPKVPPATLDQASKWLEEMQHRLNLCIKTRQNVHLRTIVAFVIESMNGITQYYRTIGNIWDTLYSKHQLRDSDITLDRVYNMLSEFLIELKPKVKNAEWDDTAWQEDVEWQDYTWETEEYEASKGKKGKGKKSKPKVSRRERALRDRFLHDQLNPRHLEAIDLILKPNQKLDHAWQMTSSLPWCQPSLSQHGNIIPGTVLTTWFAQSSSLKRSCQSSRQENGLCYLKVELLSMDLMPRAWRTLPCTSTMQTSATPLIACGLGRCGSLWRSMSIRSKPPSLKIPF